MKAEEPIHPGRQLSYTLASDGIKQFVLAQRLSVSKTYLNEIINERRPMSINFALKLEHELGIGAEYWLGLQQTYDLYKRRKQLSGL